MLSDWTLLSKTVFLIPPASLSSAMIHSSLKSFSDNLHYLNPKHLESLIHSDAIESFRTLANADHSWLPGVAGDIRKSGLAFRWDTSIRKITFSAPLIIYAQPSPLRFLVDLWFQRESVVISNWRLKRNLLRVVEYDLRVKSTDATISTAPPDPAVDIQAILTDLAAAQRRRHGAKR